MIQVFSGVSSPPLITCYWQVSIFSMFLVTDLIVGLYFFCHLSCASLCFKINWILFAHSIQNNFLPHLLSYPSNYATCLASVGKVSNCSRHIRAQQATNFGALSCDDGSEGRKLKFLWVESLTASLTGYSEMGFWGRGSESLSTSYM